MLDFLTRAFSRQPLKLKYGTISSFLVSEKTRRYYYGDGILKQISDVNPRDAWYQRVRKMTTDYEINVDVDMANRDAMTVFINHRIVDFHGNYIGATGVGLTLDKLTSRIGDYEKRFNRRIYFADQQGRIVLGSSRNRILAQSLKDIPGIAPIARDILKKHPEPAIFAYRHNDHEILLNARYIPDLGWHLLVEQDETEALEALKKTLHANLAISGMIMLLVIAVTLFTVSRHQRKLERMATTDQLTRCLNRHAFQEQWPSIAKRNLRQGQQAPLLMLDIDHFKQINDQYGHLAGDSVLQQVAHQLREQLHPQDLLVRWGGEEFLILPQHKNHAANADAMAETLRQTISELKPVWDGQTLSMTVSIGLCYWQPGESLESVTDRTDQALYQAKANGRNRLVINH